MFVLCRGFQGLKKWVVAVLFVWGGLSVLGVWILPWVFGGVVGGGYFLEIVDMDWFCPYF